MAGRSDSTEFWPGARWTTTGMLAGVLVALVAVFSGCGRPEKTAPVIVIGSDTLQIEAVRLLVPGARDDSAAITQAARRTFLGQTLVPGDTLSDDVAGKLASKLSLVTGVEYSVGAATGLFSAVTALDRMAGASVTELDFAARVDSICSAVPIRFGGKPFSCRLTNSERGMVGGGALLDDKQRLLATLLAVSGEAVQTALSFAAPQGSEANVEATVKGLIAEARAPAPAPARPVRKTAVDPAKALAYRSQASIRDSIAGHLTNLQQLYKRHLKTGEVASGTVWVTFDVDTEGRVVGVRILKSEIGNTQFLERVGQYARLIKFKPVPEAAGVMTFEFPFEFKTEEL